MHIRAARPEEAERLSRLAISSKGHWGYPQAWLDSWIDVLSVSPEAIERGRVHLAEAAGQIAGFYSLVPLSPEIVDLGHLFVAPAFLDQGIGRQLFEHLTKRAAALGFRRMLIVSDPYAASFYERCGAVRAGEQPSSIPGRNLPLYEFLLNKAKTES